MYQNCNWSGCWCVEINILCRSFFFVWWVILCILPFGRLRVCTWIHYRVKNRFVITLIIWKVILFEVYIYWYAGSFSRSLFAFSWNEVTRSITTPHSQYVFQCVNISYNKKRSCTLAFFFFFFFFKERIFNSFDSVWFIYDCFFFVHRVEFTALARDYKAVNLGQVINYKYRF